MFNKKTVKDIDVKGKKVLVRVDFNVPLDKDLNITDDSRIVSSLPTIKYLIENRAKVILISHLGRPEGKVVDKYKMDPVAKRLEELLGKKVKKLNDCIGEEVKNEINKMKEGDVILLENVRFHIEEEKNEESFAKKLAELADVFVQDAFGCVHRAHASTSKVAKFLPAVAGFLLQKEIEVMGKALTDPLRPFVAILGGAKVSDKIKVITNLLNIVDFLLIGGGMMFTFLKAKGYNTGKSIVELDKIELAKEILKKADEKKVNLKLPTDVVIADKFSEDANIKICKIEEIPENWIGMDIGPETAKEYSEIILSAKTVIWNGPLGVFEMEPFAEGTRKIAESLTRSSAISIVGGGDSVAALEKFNLSDKIYHISTGGGASLEFLEGKILPGIEVLEDK
jgi:phosphoglycerate kinase